jgi:rare lipoprotein A
MSVRLRTAKRQKHFDCMHWLKIVAICLSLAGCQGKDVRPSTPGGFYGGDRPPTNIDKDLSSVPDAVPVKLPLSKTGNKPYQALGKTYRPMADARGYTARGTASWYGKKFHGRRTSSGEPYDMFAMSAAHTILPIPSFARVTNLDNGRTVVVKVNDRGPFLHNRLIDLSYAAAWKLGISGAGTGRVEVVALDPQVAAVTQAPQHKYTGTAGTGIQSANGGFALQIGAFSELANALDLRKQLRQNGYPVRPESDQELAQNGSPYRVIAGPFPERSAAESAKAALQLLTGENIQLKEI